MVRAVCFSVFIPASHPRMWKWVISFNVRSGREFLGKIIAKLFGGLFDKLLRYEEGSTFSQIFKYWIKSVSLSSNIVKPAIVNIRIYNSGYKYVLLNIYDIVLSTKPQLSVCHLLLVNSLQNFCTAPNRWFSKRLAVAELVEDTGLFVLLLVLLERFVNVFAIF